MLSHLIRGRRPRYTRFHSCAGQRVDLAGLCYAPASLASAIRLQLTGRRSEAPVISYRASRQLAALIAPGHRVLEFGSGMSTVWFSRRSCSLVSIETDPGWFEVVSGWLRERGLTADHRLRDARDSACLDDCPDHSFDVVLIDGPRRDLAMMIALKKVRAGGYIYLDNTDLALRSHQPAKALLLKAARNVRTFVDFVPCAFYVTEGMLAQVGEGGDR